MKIDSIREMASHREGDRPRMTLAKDRVNMALNVVEEAAPDVRVEVIRSTQNPNTVKLGISGRVGRIGVVGESLPIHLGLDDLSKPGFMSSILPQGRVRREGGGRDLPYSTLRKVHEAAERVLRGLGESVPRRGVKASGGAPAKRGATRSTKGTPHKPAPRTGTPKTKVGRVTKGNSPAAKRR